MLDHQLRPGKQLAAGRHRSVHSLMCPIDAPVNGKSLFRLDSGIMHGGKDSGNAPTPAIVKRNLRQQKLGSRSWPRGSTHVRAKSSEFAMEPPRRCEVPVLRVAFRD